MKIVKIFIVVLLVAVTGNLQAQETSVINNIRPVPIALGWSKTTNILFPHAIKSVDKGSLDVLAQKAKAVENVLQLKAGKKHFKETNLTVITADGKLYSFLLKYSERPTLNFQVETDTPASRIQAKFSVPEDLEAPITEAAARVSERMEIMQRTDRSSKTRTKLTGIYVKGNILYFRLRLKNDSQIPYEIGQLRFSVRDRKIAKRTASQQLELSPILVYGNNQVIHPQSGQVLVVALEKFTIPDKKYFSIQLMESKGGRHMEIDLRHRHLSRAQSL